MKPSLHFFFMFMVFRVQFLWALPELKPRSVYFATGGNIYKCQLSIFNDSPVAQKISWPIEVYADQARLSSKYLKINISQQDVEHPLAEGIIGPDQIASIFIKNPDPAKPISLRGVLEVFDVDAGQVPLGQDRYLSPIASVHARQVCFRNGNIANSENGGVLNSGFFDVPLNGMKPF